MSIRMQWMGESSFFTHERDAHHSLAHDPGMAENTDHTAAQHASTTEPKNAPEIMEHHQHGAPPTGHPAKMDEEHKNHVDHTGHEEMFRIRF